MQQNENGFVTVFGGTGFLGGAIVRALVDRGCSVRIAARRPTSGARLAGESRAVRLAADIREEGSVAAALAGARAAVNAVSLYVERGRETFDAVHVRGAGRIAEVAASLGLEALVHVSGIGADSDSPSAYIRARGAGERAVQAAFPAATVVRPSVLFGPGDEFLRTIDALTRVAPLFPLFGEGATRLQPVFVDDVAEAVARAIDDPRARGRIAELGGPRTYSYRELIAMVLRHRARRRPLLPVPYAAWEVGARLLAWLPSPPVTSDQIALMRHDNVVGGTALTFADLGIAPRSIEELLPRCLP